MTIDTLLVANRGEIALRVFRTCRDLGIRTVAIHSDLDAGAPHTLTADAAVPVSSYLDVDAVIAAAKASGADAVHPGYGFLSERAAFAEAVIDAGLVWVGPTSDVIEKMGRKDAARDLAVAAGVPVVPSYSMTDARVAVSQELPYPVLVKAAAGGGGKGMRIVRAQEEYADAVVSARREAATAFGDDTLLVEKYVERGRHIEVQVLGDTHGNVVHLLTRECSVQRRHQKVIEEAPAPGLDDELRERIHTAAVDLARSVGYTSAGTVEFLLDAETNDFYFLEMNTRLQVEHPVTEEVTGVDLVALQLQVAAGEDLSEVSTLAARAPRPPAGHAIEVRIYAEDPYAGFLPQAGRTSIVRWSERARVDHALEPGQVVSTSYDPMLGKVVVHGPTREAARRALVAALDETAILGLTTNTGFLRELAASDAFAEPGGIDTAWLDRTELAPPDRDTARLIAAWTQALLTAGSTAGPFAADGFRLGARPAPQVVLLDREVIVDRHAGTVDGVPVRQVSAALPKVMLEIDGHRTQAVVDATVHQVEVAHRGQRFVFERPDVFADHGPVAGDGTVVAPMPGTVLDVRVAEGATVAAGDVLGVVEAMKMELALKAPYDGVVTSVSATIGQQVALGAPLFTVESGGGAG